MSSEDKFCRLCDTLVVSSSGTPVIGSERDVRVVGPSWETELYKPVQTPKSAHLAAMLEFVPAIFGLWGIGFLYLGMIRKGLSYLTVGILDDLFWLIFLGPFFPAPLFMISVVGIVVCGVDAINIYHHAEPYWNQ